MRPIVILTAVAILLLVTPNPCFALWGIAPVSSERAKELGLTVRAKAAGPRDVRVELELKAAGELKDFSRVDLRYGEGNKSLLTVPLREERSPSGAVIVSFSADRTHLDQIRLWIMVPQFLGGTAYELQVKDFVDR